MLPIYVWVPNFKMKMEILLKSMSHQHFLNKHPVFIRTSELKSFQIWCQAIKKRHFHFENTCFHQNQLYHHHVIFYTHTHTPTSGIVPCIFHMSRRIGIMPNGMVMGGLAADKCRYFLFYKNAMTICHLRTWTLSHMALYLRTEGDTFRWSGTSRNQSVYFWRQHKMMYEHFVPTYFFRRYDDDALLT